MDKIGELFSFIGKLLQWYFIVMPWEQAVFVRAGRSHRVLAQGIYFKIPFIDRVYLNTTRLRMIDAPMQTVTTKDGHAVTIKSGVSYRIVDMFKLYNTLYHPENTLLNIIMSKISQHISSTNLKDISPNSIGDVVGLAEKQAEWGLTDVRVTLNNYSVTRTFRLIQDSTLFYGEQLKMGHMDEKHN